MLFCRCFINKISLAEVYARYHNLHYGFEEHIDNNIEDSKGAIGVFHHAIFLMLLNIQGVNKYYCFDAFDNDLNINRGSEKLILKIKTKNAKIQKFNIISILAVFYKYKNSYLGGVYRTMILRQCLKNFFKFKTDSPINICYWSLFFKAGKKYPLIEFLLFPLLALKVLLTTKPLENILNLMIVHCFDDKKPYCVLRKLFIKKMKFKYGDNFIEVLMSMYYTNADHPNVQYSKGLTIQE